MTIKEVIEKADAERPNLIPNATKRRWVYELEADYCETMELDLPIYEDEQNPDVELLMQFPYDESYVKYLNAKIDYHQEEMQLYADDMMAAMQAKSDAVAWWRRNNRPTRKNHYRGVWR